MAKNLKNDQGIMTVDSNRRGKIFKRSFFIIGLLILVVGGFYVYLAVTTLKQIRLPSNEGSKPRSFFPSIVVKRLQGESENRVNILLVGIGGAKHPGGLLADTIILLSINPKDKKVALMSIPRDLYVPFPKPLSGSDKINAAHSLGEQKTKLTGGGAAYLKKTVSEVFDLKIPYIIRIDFEGFKKLVDALDGITINVEKAIYDPLYPAPNMLDYEPFSVKAGLQNFNGATALKYARSRETTSDFDRARRQQQILQAIRDKALNLNILASPKKLLDISKIIGDHFKTDLSPWELERLVVIGRDIPKTNVITKVIDNGPGGPLISVNENGYFLKPKDSTYQELKTIARNIFIQAVTTKEEAKIEIINASSKNGAGSTLAEELTQLGLTITRISKQSTPAAQTIIYDSTKGAKPDTVKLLTTKLKAQVVTSSPDALLRNSAADIVIIVGNET